MKDGGLWYMRNEGIKKNQSLRKALLILEEMTKIESPFRLQDLSVRLSMSPSTVSRFLNTFIDFGYIRKEPSTASYYLTLKLAGLGAHTRANFPFQQILTKYIREISKHFNETASLCVENDMQMVYIATEESQRHILRNLKRIGHVAPIHATGVGKCHLLNYSEAKLYELAEKKGLPRLTDQTIVSIEDLRKEIENVKQQGYALDNEECELGVRCVAVPIRDYTGTVVAAVSVSASVIDLDKKRTDEIIQYMLDIKKRASSEMGWE